MDEIFANSRIQTLAVPLPPQARFGPERVGRGWQRCVCRPEGVAVRYPYIQWQVIQGTKPRLFLAVDTSCGDREVGFFCDREGLVGDFAVRLAGLLGLDGRPLEIPPVAFVIRPPVGGDPRDVHLVVDLGNSRTGALILEMSGETAPVPQMVPLRLANRWQLDGWQAGDDGGDAPSEHWFSARTLWCTTPHLPPEPSTRTVYREVRRAGLLHERVQTLGEKVSVTPDLFRDISMARMGTEADLIGGAIRLDGDERTGLSSPKRYLWADDESWLEGANWFMADPSDRHGGDAHAARLQGPLLRYIPEDDPDVLIEGSDLAREPLASEAPARPRHAPRILMVAAIYELLCQAFSYIHSRPYRRRIGGASRPRRLRSLSLSYPSGIMAQERDRLRRQAEKAALIFHATLGSQQEAPPMVSLGIDEASAVHLTYIWSELRMLGQDSRLWFRLVGRERAAESPPGPEAAAVAPDASPADPGSPRPRRARPPREAAGEPGHDLRIACIDIGGGTSDLMIARYTCQQGIEDSIRGEILHRDGISVAGDQLVKRLLERVVVPAFAEAIGLDDATCQLLFGPEIPRNRELRPQRVQWVNRLFVPLAQAYLDAAVSGSAAEISHTDPSLVPEDVLASLGAVLDRIKGAGYCDLREGLGLRLDRALLDDVVHEVFHDLLLDLCGRIVAHDVDVVLLAGQPTKLAVVQDLLRLLLPLPPSRVIPMYRHYAGNWYPYQDAAGRNPGLIIDPKSAVVVGASIHFLAHHGLLPQFRFAMTDTSRANAFHWGVMTGAVSGIPDDRLLFRPRSPSVHEFVTSSRRVLIGRRLSESERAEASPAYLLKVDTGDRLGRTEIKVRIRRASDPGTGEEILELESVEGEVAGEPAVAGGNVTFTWRTLADEHFFLDSGGLDNIEPLAR
ncbi:Virulence factor SrfB [Aquisphaera giovannonii]|uniref:Virulence factor SrfB n=1 Tax=Aquisphaera giovannonii TaxID=406548 RepID=A0A5B9VVG7_9BACT|nr:virulence factor SrfB [Aquisphaera giovannonii]QEH32064.1 Virulence factor SrfB [Aquisphaera giovannonii]